MQLVIDYTDIDNTSSRSEMQIDNNSFRMPVINIPHGWRHFIIRPKKTQSVKDNEMVLR